MAELHDVQAFRERYRQIEIGASYVGWAHFAFTSMASIAVVAWLVSLLDNPTGIELLTVPVAFLFANLVEYLVHRGPLHNKTGGLGVLYQRHTRQHHRFFTHDTMRCESSRDFKMVMFPPAMFFIVVFPVTSPLTALLYYTLGANTAWLFAAVAVAYFLTYEWLHFAYHLDPTGPIGRLPGLAVLRRLHTNHHDPRRMSHANFNITFPICDLLLGTWERGEG